jgi:hypothetical protein
MGKEDNDFIFDGTRGNRDIAVEILNPPIGSQFELCGYL